MKFGASAIVLLVFLLFPVRMRLALDRVERHPGLAAFVGIAAVIAVVPIAILLAITIIGIPLIVLEFAAVFVGIWLGTGRSRCWSAGACRNWCCRIPPPHRSSR